MAFLDDLAALGKQLPPSHLPVAHDILYILGALAAHIEHGEAFLTAARDDNPADALNSLLGDAAEIVDGEHVPDVPGPSAEAPAPELPAPAGAVEFHKPTEAELLAEIQSLSIRLADLQKVTAG